MPVNSAADELVIVAVAVGTIVLLYLRYCVMIVCWTTSMVLLVYHQFRNAPGAYT